jgi:toxin ParE1/3/4
MLELVFRPLALADLDAIYDYIAPDNPRRAATFVQDILTRCRTLCTHPEMGPARPDIAPALRIHPMLGRVVVCYRIIETEIVVLRVFYGGQDFETIMRDENQA